MHPYAGVPVFEEEAELIDDSDPPNASNFNTGPQGALDRTAWLRQHIGSGPALNWYPEQTVAGGAFLSTSTDFLAGAWDPFLLKWIVASVGVSAIVVWSSYGLDGNEAAGWTDLGGVGTGTSACVSADPSTLGNYWCVHANDDGTNNGTVLFSKYNGSSFSTILTLSLTSSSSNIQKPRCILFAGQLLVAIGNNTGTHGSNVNPVVFDLATTPQQLDPDFPANDWLLASNAAFGGPDNLCLLVPRNTSQASTFGSYLTTPNGTAYELFVMAFLTSTQTCVGLCWTTDGQGGCFLLAVYDSSTHKTSFMRSGDGVNWAVQSTPSTAFQIADMQCLSSGLVVATLVEASSTGPSGTVFSPDGGVTWYFSPATFTSSVAQTAANYEQAKVVAGSGGFMQLNNLWLRFSHLQRLPTVAL